MKELSPEIHSLLEFTLTAIIYSVIPTLIMLFLTEKIKTKIKGNLDERIEMIRKDHSLEISKFQTELNFLKTRENFKFTKLHEKRIEVLESVYKSLNEVIRHLHSYVVPVKQTPVGSTFDEHDDLLSENFRNAHNKFVTYYSDNKIYLDDEIEKLIDEYMNETSEIYNDYSENHFLRKLGDKGNPESLIKSALAYKKIPEKVIPIKKRIEIKFKKLLEE